MRKGFARWCAETDVNSDARVCKFGHGAYLRLTEKVED